MIAVPLSLLAIFILLVVNEWLWRTKKIKGELGRKFIHITVGTFVAFWPFYMSFRSIRLIALAFLVVVLLSKQLNLFSAIHTVVRKGWGEVLYAVGIGLSATITNSPWVFAAAILHLSLADGLAAVIGKRYGKGNEYKVFGFTKSKVGTATFWLTSVSILLIIVTHATHDLLMVLPLIAWLPVAAAAMENIGVYGLDNIFIPVLIVIALSQLQFAF